jgi:3-deoxy-D-manno-octulosonic-acid transferase
MNETERFWETTNKALATRKEPLVHVNMRLPQEVVNFYKQEPNYTKAMREALVKVMQMRKEEDDDDR